MLKLILICIVINSISGIQNNIETHENIVLLATSPEQNQNYFSYKKNEDGSARQFLRYYNSFNPVVLLVEDTARNRNQAANFFENVHKLNQRARNINFLIMKFNTTGVTPILEESKNDSVHLLELLREDTTKSGSHFLGQSNSNGTAFFFGILNAVHQLPPRSGIVVFMSQEVGDEILTSHALKDVSNKEVQVFINWSGKGKDNLLKDLAAHTRGTFTKIYDNNQIYYEDFLENIDSYSSVSTILSLKNLKGSRNLLFPIDSDVTGIHISISPNITQGVLTTPRGYSIDVLRNEDVEKYSVGSFTKLDQEMHEIHLNTTTATTQDVGIWRFRIDNARALYNITIFAHTQLTTNAVLTIHNRTGDATATRKKILKLGVNGDVSSITNVSFVDRNGVPILTNVKFTLNKDWENHLMENVENIETNSQNLDINVEKLPTEPFYAVVEGKDSQGHDFRRLSYVQNNIQKEFYLPPITIDVGIGSELITQPYRQPQIYFEVTNNGRTPTLVRFFSRDEKGLLETMTPWYKWINPQETATVRLTLTTRSGFTQDVITFTAAGSETVTKRVIVDIGSSLINDRKEPELDYHFTSDCTNVLFGACEDGTWTVEVKAKDTGSGLLQITSIPKGIYFPHGFTTGTTEEVTGYFSESCCNPDLKLVAYDRQNNRRSRHLNAYRAKLGPGAIAAIVLGVILFILIIIAIVLLSRKFCRCCKKKESYDLPVYRGPRGSKRS